MINSLMAQKFISKYQLAKVSGVPYTTVSDICSGKTQPTKCAAETIYKLAQALNVTVEDLLSPFVNPRCSFDVFKSNACHRLKAQGDIAFLIEVLEKDEIRKYHNKKWYAESLYLLAMVDYLSRLHNIPLCAQYNDMRHTKLRDPIFPSSVLVAAAVSSESDAIKKSAIRESIPEFIRFNIVESEVRNVI